MSARSQFTFVGEKKFYKAIEICRMAKVEKKVLIDTAILAEAFYDVNGVYLVNKEKLDAFCTKMRIYNLDARSVYIGPKEAAVQLGISMEMVHQLASRADALYRINGNYFVHVGKVNDYFQHFQVKVANDFENVFEALRITED